MACCRRTRAHSRLTASRPAERLRSREVTLDAHLDGVEFDEGFDDRLPAERVTGPMAGSREGTERCAAGR